MTDTTQSEDPKPRRRRTTPLRRVRARAPSLAKPTVPDELLGLTATDCAAACVPERCVISCAPYCAHPKKGGLQVVDLSNPDRIGRLQRARLVLAHTALDKRLKT